MRGLNEKWMSSLIGNIRLADKDRVFYRYSDEQHSYYDLCKAVEKICALLQKAPDGPVVVYAEKSFSTYAAITAILLSGKCWVQISTSSPSAHIKGVLDQLDPGLIIVDGVSSTNLEEKIDLAEVNYANVNEILTNSEPAEIDYRIPEADNVAMIYFTSGSTGIPKGVRITFGNMTAMIEQLSEILPYRDDDVLADYHELSFVISIPVLCFVLFTGRAISPSLTKIESWLPMKHLLDNLVTTLITLPSTMECIKRLTGGRGVEIQLDTLVLCGEPLKSNLLKFVLDEINPDRCINFYGSTEVSPWVFSHECKREDTINPKYAGVTPIGKALSMVDYEIDEDSILNVSGPQVSFGYLHEDNESFYAKGNKWWFKTGDIVEVEGDVLLCKGRYDSQIKISGHRVDLIEIEVVAANTLNLQFVHAFHMEKESGGQIVLVLKSDETDWASGQLVKELAKVLPGYKVPAQIYFIDEVPINKNGKLDRKKVKQDYLAASQANTDARNIE